MLKMSFHKHLFPLILFIFLLSAGCRSISPDFHIRQDVDFGFIKRIAVLPFENITDARFANEIVRQIVITEFLASGLVDVVVPGEVITAMKSLQIKSISSLNTAQIKALGQALKVQAVIFGAVEQYGTSVSGNFSAPEITITLMMADTSSGSIIWSITKSDSATSFMARHFGTKSKTMSELAQSVVREAIQTFTEY
jgi:TolB-like protein